MSSSFVLIQTKLGIECKDLQMKQIWSDNGFNLFSWKEPISSSRSNILSFVAVIFFLPIVMRKTTWLKWALQSNINFFLVL